MYQYAIKFGSVHDRLTILCLLDPSLYERIRLILKWLSIVIRNDDMSINDGHDSLLIVLPFTCHSNIFLTW